MKSLIFVFLISASLGVAAFAQNVKPKVAALPADIANWRGETSDKILDNAAIKTRLKKLLGRRNYASFLESFETLAPIEKNDEILFSDGCLIQACGHLESAIAIDFVNNIIYAAIYRENEKTKYFKERSGRTTKFITNWVKRLSSLNNSKQS